MTFHLSQSLITLLLSINLFIETAINIGYSCQLLTDDMIDVFVVDGVTKQEVDQQLKKYRESIKIVNTYHPNCKFLIVYLN